MNVHSVNLKGWYYPTIYVTVHDPRRSFGGIERPFIISPFSFFFFLYFSFLCLVEFFLSRHPVITSASYVEIAKERAARHRLRAQLRFSCRVCVDRSCLIVGRADPSVSTDKQRLLINSCYKQWHSRKNDRGWWSRPKERYSSQKHELNLDSR